MTAIPGAAFDPSEIAILRNALDDAVAHLPAERRTSVSKAHLAERILQCAAKGERDPVRLRTAALIEIVE